MVFNNNARWAIGSNKSQFSAGYRQSLIILLCETQVEGDCPKMPFPFVYSAEPVCELLHFRIYSYTYVRQTYQTCAFPATRTGALQRVRDDEEKGQK